MVQDKKIVKITKQSYRFELRKKYSNRKKFKLVEKRPIDLVLQSLRGPAAARKDPSTGPSIKSVLIPLAFLAFLALAFLVIFLAPQSQQGPSQQFMVLPKLAVDFSEGGIANTGGRVADKAVGYYTLSYAIQDADNASVRTSAYSERVPNQVFILSSKMDQSTTYPQFRYALKKRLESKGFPLSEITLGQLETLPGGSILIIPGGLMPEKLTQPGGANLLSLIQRGVYVVYIGQRFDATGFTLSETGARRGVSADFASKLPFSFESANLDSGGKLHTTVSLYRVRSGGYSSDSGLLYGMVSLVRFRNPDSAMLFVPEVLDHGWEQPEYAAEDIDKIITELVWIPAESGSELALQAGNQTVRSFFFTEPFQGSQKTVVSRVTAYKNGNATERIRVFYLQSGVNGNLFYRDEVTDIVSGKLTEKETSFALSLRENSSEERRMFLSIRDAAGLEVDRAPVAQGASGRVPLLGDVEFSRKLSLDPGAYVASVVDDGGKPYARMVINVLSVDFQPTSTDFQSGVFGFSVVAGGQPVRVKSVKVTVDGKYPYSFSDSSNVVLNMAKDLKGEQLSAGNHTFVFESGEVSKTVVLNNVVNYQFYQNPVYWALGILAVALFLGAPYVAGHMRKENYSLDIPDFPPLSSMKIPVRKETVFNVLNKVNEDYRWKCTPLTLEEIKKGFKKVIYQNKPLFISDYNLEYVLEQLANKDLVKHALDYYGLSEWEQSTGRSVKYLAMQRKIRDICINEAIPFSKDDSKGEYDMYLKVIGQDVFVYLMDSSEAREEKLSFALKAMQKGLVVLLFESAEDKKDFEDTINSASESGGLVKLEIMSGSIVLQGMREFEKMLKEMKNI